MTVRAIYENGTFRPLTPVNLPEKAEVEVVLPGDQEEFARRERARIEVTEILSRRHRSGQTDTAERHNEHQP
jgi:predicted DNA-binding antitoxin AbrB/MazE fold protein